MRRKASREASPEECGVIMISNRGERTIPQRDLGALLRALEAVLTAYPAADALRNQVVFLPAIPR